MDCESSCFLSPCSVLQSGRRWPRRAGRVRYLQKGDGRGGRWREEGGGGRGREVEGGGGGKRRENRGRRVGESCAAKKY